MGKYLILSVVAALVLLALVAACGAKTRRASLPGELQPGITVGEPAPVSIEDALGELKELPAPEGVDPSIFEELRQSLAESLAERSGEKHASSEPSDEGRRVKDLTLHVEPGGSSATLEWHYRNDGDYNQDGIVDIADIVPLARHFGEDATDPNTLAGVPDGNHNGKVGMSDITPIAVNYGAEVVAYCVSRSSYEWYVPETPFEYGYIGAVELSDGLGKENGRVRFSYSLSYDTSYWYRVRPIDRFLIPGLASDPATSASTYSVFGYVFDHENQGLSGVALTLNGMESAVTDASGKFSFSDVPCGNHTLTPSVTGMLFFPKSRRIIVEGADVHSCIFGAERALPGTWHVTNIGNLGYIGSVAFINGKLAASLYMFSITNYGTDTVAYMQSADSSGSSWQAPVTVVQADSYAPLLAEVNGNPALVFYDTTSDYIVYVRADDPDGTSWGEPTALAFVEDYAYFSFSTVGGRPAVVYYGEEEGTLYYRPSRDENGDEWYSTIRIAWGMGDSSVRCSLAEVDGLPAVAYSVEDESVFFTIADDESGFSWSDPVEVGHLHSSYHVDRVSLAVIDQKPAIVYSDYSVAQVLYAEALDPAGTEWSEPFLLNRWEDSFTPYLCEVDGEPAIAYRYMYCTRRAGVWSYTRTPSLSGSNLAGLVVDDGTPIVAHKASGSGASNWITRLE